MFLKILIFHARCFIPYITCDLLKLDLLLTLDTNGFWKVYEKSPPPLLPPPPPLQQKPPLLDWVCSASSSTITTLRRVLLVLVRVDFCSASSARCIMRRVRSKNISSMFRFNFADVWKCTAPTCLAYLKKNLYDQHFIHNFLTKERENNHLTLPLPPWQHFCLSPDPLYCLLLLSKSRYPTSSWAPSPSSLPNNKTQITQKFL